jgi:hypothetical protein
MNHNNYLAKEARQMNTHCMYEHMLDKSIGIELLKKKGVDAYVC